MIIDFHTHTFPDKIAAKALKGLSATANGVLPHTDGTEAGLRASMRENGIDDSVVMPVATAAHQVEGINNNAIAINGIDGLWSFGAMHYEYMDYQKELRRIKDAGLKGIKLHHDYMQLRFDDRRSIEIMQEAFRLGLLVLIHAGNDPVSPDVHYCTPKMIHDVLPELQKNLLIASHYGGLMNMDEVEKYLMGEDIYIDTSMAHHYYGLERLRNILTHHPSDRILFGSDSPWENQATSLRLLKSMSLSDELIRKITWDNPARLLGISQ